MTLVLVLGTLLVSVVLLVVSLYVFFGPGIEPAHRRVALPLRDVEKQFLADHVADGVEETGFLERPRAGGRLAKIFYRYWHPKRMAEAGGDAKGVLVVLHGLNSHSARNNTFMVEVLASGFIVAGMDHEGFGRSDGRHGYFESVDHLVDDAIAFIQLTRDKYKGRKLFVQGGSLGGLMVLHVLAKIEKGLVDGAVIQCPAVQIHENSRPSPALEAVAKVLRALSPKIPFAKGNRGKNSSPEVAAIVDAMKRADPLFYNGRLRIGTGLAMLEAITAIDAKLPRIDAPYLLQHGTADFVCHISGSQQLHEKTASRDKEFRAYPGGAHDLSNEPPHIRNAVVQDFVAWLEARVR
ncbi:hypothetical protein ATCC90586_000201 [Pythium insidiosum]|nr:hypothetical protein ATCC90586_000201 [Pythium insidiosum]